MSKLVGLSLSFCITDIIFGNVAVDDVEMIIAGTAWTESMLLQKLDEYCRLEWRHNPELARQVFWELWNSGRIDQPRLRGDKDYQVPNLGRGHWVG